MAAETPVLERKPTAKFRTQFNATQSYMDCFNEEEAHNARIRDTYARLINPDCTIADIINSAKEEDVVEDIVDDIVKDTEEQNEAAPVRPYLVENARADSAIFRADNPINKVKVKDEIYAEAEGVDYEDDDEDLRPTPTTIQYQTVNKANARVDIKSSDKKEHILGKKEKIIIAVFVGIVLALLTLVIVNSSIIAGLSADMASVQSEITTVRGALAGVNATVAEIVPETVRNLLIK